jgi:hypothetical protein
VNWDNHLSPTIALFLDILQNHTDKSSDSILFDTLTMINQRPIYAIKEGYYIWDSRQECFRFFTGLLLFIDVVASTSLERPPQLLRYHPQLLSNGDDGTHGKGEPTIRLSNLVGCRNWAMRLIADVSALDAWKKESMRKGINCEAELIERAYHITRMLEDVYSQIGISGAALTGKYWSNSYVELHYLTYFRKFYKNLELRGENIPYCCSLGLAAIVTRGTIQCSTGTSVATCNGWLFSIAGAGLAALCRRLYG